MNCLSYLLTLLVSISKHQWPKRKSAIWRFAYSTFFLKQHIIFNVELLNFNRTGDQYKKYYSYLLRNYIKTLLKYSFLGVFLELNTYALKSSMTYNTKTCFLIHIFRENIRKLHHYNIYEFRWDFYFKFEINTVMHFENF